MKTSYSTPNAKNMLISETIPSKYGNQACWIGEARKIMAAHNANELISVYSKNSGNSGRSFRLSIMTKMNDCKARGRIRDQIITGISLPPGEIRILIRSKVAKQGDLLITFVPPDLR